VADDWIKVRSALPTDGRVKVVSRTCHATTVTVFGALVTLWCLGDTHANDEGLLHGYTAEDIDALVGIPGFCDALPADWIDISGEWVKLPDYQEHNGTTAKARAQATKRKRRERTVTLESRSHRDTSVTREEKRREEKKEQKTAPSVDLFPGVNPQVVADFLAMRKSQRAAVTATAVSGLQREATKAGVTMEFVLTTCCERGWRGFKAEWLANDGRQGTSPKASLGNPWDGAL
jgi:hypothetical protein